MTTPTLTREQWVCATARCIAEIAELDYLDVKPEVYELADIQEETRGKDVAGWDTPEDAAKEDLRNNWIE